MLFSFYFITPVNYPILLKYFFLFFFIEYLQQVLLNLLTYTFIILGLIPLLIFFLIMDFLN